MSTSEVLTVDEAAALLRVNRKTVYDAIKRGEVPGVLRLGKTIRLSRAAMLDWVRGNAGSAHEEERRERTASEVD